MFSSAIYIGGLVCYVQLSLELVACLLRACLSKGTKVEVSFAMEKFLFVCVCSMILLVCAARPTNENKRQFKTTCTYWRYHLCGTLATGVSFTAVFRTHFDIDFQAL